MAGAAHSVSIRIAASSLDAHPSVQEPVIGSVLTNHERRIVATTTIGMMNDSSGR